MTDHPSEPGTAGAGHGAGPGGAPMDAQDSPGRGSAARGIMLGVLLSSVLWVGLALVAFRLG